MDKVICIGKNYLEHAKELGDAIPEKPVLFIKPPSVILEATQKLETLYAQLPTQKGSVHHECEIALKIGSQKNITHITLGLDMTLRDLQTKLKKSGHPWEIAKTFQHSIILAPWTPISEFPDFLNIPFTFLVNGSLRQSSTAREMRLSPQDCIHYAGEYFPICSGDILMTGTPKGVEAIHPGQTGQLLWGNHINTKIVWS